MIPGLEFLYQVLAIVREDSDLPVFSGVEPADSPEESGFLVFHWSISRFISGFSVPGIVHIESGTLENYSRANTDESAKTIAVAIRAFFQSTIRHVLKEFKTMATITTFIIISRHITGNIIRIPTLIQEELLNNPK